MESGVLYCAGLIAGEGIVGILLAVFAVLNISTDISGIYGDSFTTVGNWVGIAFFAALLATIFFVCRKKKVVEIDTTKEN